jgi:hypothetical protein
MARFSELLQKLVPSEGDIAEGQERLARQAELAGELDRGAAGIHRRARCARNHRCRSADWPLKAPA